MSTQNKKERIDPVGVLSIEDNGNMENEICKVMMSFKEEDVVIVKLEESGLPPVNKENILESEVAAAEDKIPSSSNKTTEDIIEGESGNVNRHEIDDQPLDTIFEFDENGTPMMKNGQTLSPKELCNRFFLYKYYNIHKKKPPTSEIPCKRDICNKVVTLKLHQELHSDECQYECDICKKRFKNNDILSLHKRIHTKLKPFSCDICNLTFEKSKYIKVRVESRAKKKLHICETCDKSFSEPNMSDKLYPCLVCGKRFARKNLVRAHHKSVHCNDRPFACKHCDKRFKMKSGLRIHSVVHTNEKPNICGICGKQYGYRKSVRDHMRTHTGETPYCCEKCPASFKYSFLRNKHMKMHND
ncbi:hypothetical protein Trydic_g2722 [Trypoxylus dichotomus]